MRPMTPTKPRTPTDAPEAAAPELVGDCVAAVPEVVPEDDLEVPELPEDEDELDPEEPVEAVVAAPL